MKNFMPAIFVLTLFATGSFAQHAPLIGDTIADLLHSELSGESAKRNLEYVARLHRMRGSAEFKSAVTFIESKLKEYHLEDIDVFQIPADGKSMYGTQKSRMAWEAEFAELWEMQKTADGWMPLNKIADYESIPVVLAEDSESGDITAEVVDIGAGTSEKDYQGKDIKGKLVLTSSSPSSIVDLAVGKFGAAGILSYTQNQKTAWWKEDTNLIRWGHFESFSKTKSFCFMLSIKQALELQQRLAKGESITMHAKVKAGQHVGNYDFATAVIKGTTLKEEEIVFTCHLDHQRPGANDNASGCMTILEIARTLKKLIDEGKMARPARTLRFMWSPEIEGTSALLSQRPGYYSKIKAVIHMDMVGGGPVTKSVFHVAGAPMSLPSFVADVGQTIGRFVNEESDHYASGYYLASVSNKHVKSLQDVITQQALRRKATMLARVSSLPKTEADVLIRKSYEYEAGVYASLESFIADKSIIAKGKADAIYPEVYVAKASPSSGTTYRRNTAVKGPMSVFGYDYFSDHFGEDQTNALRLLSYKGKGGYYAYEALNFVNGKRTTMEIRDALSAEFGPIPLEIVEEFLKAAESIKVIEPVLVVKKS